MLLSKCILGMLLAVVMLSGVFGAPTKLDIMGERNSGTNWVAAILGKNFGSKNLLPLSNNNNIYKKYKGLYSTEFGWKHGFVRKDLIVGNAKAEHDVTFFVIFRNPYSWLLSMQKMPHHAPHHNHLPLLQFVSKEWHCYGAHESEFVFELDPDTQKPFANVVAMRTAKYKAWLKLNEIVDNVVFVNYEQIVADDGLSMVEAGAKGGLTRTAMEFKPEHGRCGAFGWRNGCSGQGSAAEREQRRSKARDETYMKTWYDQPEALLHVNKFLDEEMENSLGYEFRYPKEE